MSRFILRLFDLLVLLVFIIVVAFYTWGKLTKKEKLVIEDKHSLLSGIIGEKNKQ
ncbi:conserved exported hypothetical protein [Methylacidiphilum fumariolicum SolV]|uniref:Uncharacterized protein n=2 Tax=Candidatus Methylacidiphilum fumarolicum TaxID=591154 RepID=I0JYE5_METFB|nr:conserved protein of unknown function [Candidatus Methylacidiphilum fumarolicum]CCG92264.1 conserved exported hypothetical protein [Methylacidiphilum fumariolicum SolV]